MKTFAIAGAALTLFASAASAEPKPPVYLTCDVDIHDTDLDSVRHQIWRLAINYPQSAGDDLYVMVNFGSFTYAAKGTLGMNGLGFDGYSLDRTTLRLTRQMLSGNTPVYQTEGICKITSHAKF